MNAVRVHRFGGPEVVSYEEVAQPNPEAGELLVRVKAAGVGPWDAWIRSGASVLPQPLPLTLGADLAGTVVAVGDEPSPFVNGDEVYGVTNDRFVGAYADYALASVRKVGRMPRGIDAVVCASVPVVAVTAMQLLDRAGVSAGQTVLVHGGAGNVGSYAVRLARLRGANVVATTRSADDAAYAASVGADRAIDTSRSRFEEVLGTVDAVIDTVGAGVQGRSLPLLRSGGAFVSAVVQPDVETARLYGVRSEFLLVDVSTDALTHITRLFETGALRPLVGVTLPLRAARTAHEMLDGLIAHPRGKIVLAVA